MPVTSKTQQRRKRPDPVVDGAPPHVPESDTPPGDSEAVIAEQFKDAVLGGQSWHLALLETIGKWVSSEEEYQGRHYRYLIQGEAFDWILLAERLCCELDGAVSQEELELLFFQGRLPVSITASEFKGLVGYNKHRAFLNYWYGVVVEEALQLAVEEEARKRQRSKGLPDTEDLVEQAFSTLYDDTRANLLKAFQQEMKYSRRSPLTLTELKEFTYWLFKGRLKQSEPARVASDTRKGLQRLANLRGVSSPF